MFWFFLLNLSLFAFDDQFQDSLPPSEPESVAVKEAAAFEPTKALLPDARGLSLGGDLLLEYRVGMRPQGDANTSRFELPRLLLQMEYATSKTYMLHVEAEAGRAVNDSLVLKENNSGVEQEEFRGFASRVRKAYVSAQKGWRFGLIPSLWIEALEGLQAVQKLGPHADNMENQMGTQAIADLGVSYNWQKPFIELGIAGFNGTGQGREEQGMSKDAELAFQVKLGNYRILGSYLYGFYDNLPQKTGKKHRTRIGFYGDWSFMDLLAFHVFAQDNSKQAESLGLYDGVHIEKTNQTMHSFSNGVQVRLKFSRGHTIFYRLVGWDVEKEFAGNDIIDEIAGVTINGEVLWALGWSKRAYGRRAVNGVSNRDTVESLRLSASLSF